MIGNTATGNYAYYGVNIGIYLYSSNNNTLNGNDASNNQYGISLSASSKEDVFINNIMNVNAYNFVG